MFLWEQLVYSLMTKIIFSSFINTLLISFSFLKLRSAPLIQQVRMTNVPVMEGYWVAASIRYLFVTLFPKKHILDSSRRGRNVYSVIHSGASFLFFPHIILPQIAPLHLCFLSHWDATSHWSFPLITYFARLFHASSFCSSTSPPFLSLVFCLRVNLVSADSLWCIFFSIDRSDLI